MLRRIKQVQRSFDSKSAGELADDLIEMSQNALIYIQTLNDPIYLGAIILTGIGVIIHNLLMISGNGQGSKLNWSFLTIGCVLGLIVFGYF